MNTAGHAAAQLVTFALCAGWISFATAQTPTQLSPPAAPAAPATKPAAKPAPSKPAATQSNKAAPAPAAPAAAQTNAGGELDLAYGAFQRGHYVTAFSIATQRADEQKDVKAMTLLGELYANGLGVERDDKKAAEWYGLAVERGDREAMFALAMLQLAGRTGSGNREQGAKLLAAAAKLGHAVAAYDLALLYIEGQMFPQDFSRAAELFRSAAQVGLPEAQYALATLYKEGRGVEKDLAEAVRLLAAASSADNTDAQVEYAIALFNGTGGIARNERLAATLLAKAARKGNPVAQNRLANILAVGRGVQANAVEAVKWHIIAKAGGVGDIPLDTFMQQQTPETRSAAEKAAKPWLDAIKEQRESHALDVTALCGQTPRLTSRVHRASSKDTSPGQRACAAHPMLRSALLNVMIKAARKASRTLKRDFGEVEHLQVSLKGPANFVTAADHRAEEIVREELEQARPGYSFVGEEGGVREGTDRTHRWIVDPIDGTLNFLHGIPHFAISIALEREGTIIAGLVYNPATDELFTAERGKGAFLNDQRLRVAARRRLADAVVACGLPHPSRGDSELSRNEHIAVQNKIAGLRRFGAAALDLAWVAAGRIDAYWERGLSPWDMAGGIALVREAGGFVTDLDGRDDMIKSGGILVGNEDIHRELLRTLKDARKTTSIGSAAPA